LPGSTSPTPARSTARSRSCSVCSPACGFPRARLRIRLDGGFAGPEIFEFLEAEGAATTPRGCQVSIIRWPGLRHGSSRADEAQEAGHRPDAAGDGQGVMRAAALALAVGLLATSAATEAQQPGGSHRLGLLAGGSVAATAFVRAAVLAGLADLGYREGQNVALVERYADGRFERLPELAAELVGLKVDVLLTSTTPATLAAKRATSAIPIVVVTGGDLVGAGVVRSLARPEGNVTGLSFLGTELSVKQMELLKQIAPAAQRLALLANGSIQPEVLFFREMALAAPGLGVSVRFVDAKGLSDYEAAFAAMSRERVEGLVVAPNLINLEHRKTIVSLAAKARLPAVYQSREFADSGGLVSYGINRSDFFRRAAVHVAKILKGARPADLPIEQPTRFELVVNLRAARALGLVIPAPVLARVDTVIE
jgi:putative ABC transport system substrate-binding protein